MGACEGENDGDDEGAAEDGAAEEGAAEEGPEVGETLGAVYRVVSQYRERTSSTVHSTNHWQWGPIGH